ncbi:hypothetical protein [Aminobacter sp. MDW-2]|uniref:hypothetical protein n=1 Tax=Aminobacter sp. MDW-2 TaxID=2666139 RepID=UPI0012B033BA|nr:hypothetical protein [Aminobacter sp. MDW-2]MRX32798.1 hypothetical protein [Aminobacter sp. MDW-2]QNH34540.1 hypothetical protein H5P29_00885 [Aminobacter sp. MDW-2]
MDSFERGMAARDRIDNRKRENENRKALETIETDTKKVFDAEVAAGKQEEKNYDQFWKQYALPRRKQELLRQGDVAGAKQLEEWGNSDAALRGGRLFSSAMLKAQTGDPAGALGDVIKAGQVQGYIDHGYELVGQDQLVDKDGNLLGFQLTVKDAKGKELKQDIAINDIPRMISTFANPDAAWQSQIAKKAEDAKQEQELKTYRAKKKIDSEEKGAGDGEDAYRKAHEARMKNDLDFAGLSQAEQDKVVRQDLDAATSYARSRNGGGSAQAPAAPKRVLVDKNTGKAVSVPAPNPAAAPAPSPAAKQPVGVDGVQRAPLPDANPSHGLAPSPASAPAPRPRAPSRQEVIAEAADHVVKGGNPELVGQRLMQAGIPQNEWPDQLKQAMVKRQQQPGFGLGQ